MEFFSNNKIIADILKDKIIKNIHSYFPEDKIENPIVKLSTSFFHSYNFVSLFELILNTQGEKKRIIAKYVLPEVSAHGDKREFKRLNILYGNENLSLLNCCVPRPLDYFEDLRIILTEMSVGIKLSDLFKKTNSIFISYEKRQYLISLMNRCGQCLKILHDINSVSKKSRIINNSYNELFVKLIKSFNFLFDKNLISTSIKYSFFAFIKKVEINISEKDLPLVIQHGDYNINNFILKGNKITILDFTFAQENLIYNDISQFLLSLDIINPYPHNLFFNFRNIDIYKNSFLKGYFINLSNINNLDWVLIHLYTLRNLLINFKRRYERYSSYGLRGNFFIFIRKLIYNKKLKEEIKIIDKLLLKL